MRKTVLVLIGDKRRRVSRQYAHQLKRLREGKCIDCGNNRENKDLQRCEECRQKVNARERKRRGLNAWVPGGLGRRPKGMPDGKNTDN